MKRTFAVLATVAFLGVVACAGEDDMDDMEMEDEVEVTPAPAPVVTDTMPMDTTMMDTLSDTMATDTM